MTDNWASVGVIVSEVVDICNKDKTEQDTRANACH